MIVWWAGAHLAKADKPLLHFLGVKQASETVKHITEDCLDTIQSHLPFKTLRKS